MLKQRFLFPVSCAGPRAGRKGRSHRGGEEFRRRHGNDLGSSLGRPPRGPRPEEALPVLQGREDLLRAHGDLSHSRSELTPRHTTTSPIVRGKAYVWPHSRSIPLDRCCYDPKRGPLTAQRGPHTAQRGQRLGQCVAALR